MLVACAAREGGQMFTEKTGGKLTRALSRGRLFPSAILCLLAHNPS